jgi:hypothetical protein
MEEKRALSMQERILDESRRKLRERLVALWGFDLADSPVVWMIGKVREPFRSRLELLKKQLEELLEQVEELTRGNEYLIGGALDHLDQSIGFLKQFQWNWPPTYDGEGRLRSDASKISQTLRRA